MISFSLLLISFSDEKSSPAKVGETEKAASMGRGEIQNTR